MKSCKGNNGLGTAALVGVCMLLLGNSGCLSYSHYKYTQREAAAKPLPEGAKARPGRIYFVSYPENRMDVSILGWEPNVGHASLVTVSTNGVVKQYDYGSFRGGTNSRFLIGYAGDGDLYGAVQAKQFKKACSSWATNDLEVAKRVLKDMRIYGNTVEVWAKDVDDIGVAERYFENFANDKDRGSMAWRCWQIGGYRCGNITRQAFDAARGEGHYLDLLWGGFPGADAPSIGTEKTVFVKEENDGHE